MSSVAEPMHTNSFRIGKSYKVPAKTNFVHLHGLHPYIVNKSSCPEPTTLRHISIQCSLFNLFCKCESINVMHSTLSNGNRYCYLLIIRLDCRLNFSHWIVAQSITLVENYRGEMRFPSAHQHIPLLYDVRVCALVHVSFSCQGATSSRNYFNLEY